MEITDNRTTIRILEEADVCGRIGGIRGLLCDYIQNVKGGILTPA